MKVRFIIIAAFCLMLYGALSAKLYSIQVRRGDYYTQRALAREAVLEGESSRRGQLYFTDRFDTKIPAALNRDYPMVYAVPKEVKDVKGVAYALSSVLGTNAESLIKALSNSRLLFRLIKEKLTAEEEQKIKALNLTGIYTGERESRLYPFNTLAAQTIGFVGLNDEANAPMGLYGLEKFHEGKLRAGTDVSLTIDRNIQAESEQILQKLITTYEAELGTIIVQEPSTGKIVAMATMPDFNPNSYGEYSVNRFSNMAVSAQYEPGSVFKPITMAIGIETGAVTPNTTYIDSGSVTLNGKTIRNWDLKAHGRVTMTNVIEQSINTGTVYVESRIGHSKFLEFVKKFGLGEKTNIDTSDEAVGNIRNLEKKDIKDIDYATASFGQGTALTPIQLVSAFSAIANGGLMMRPYMTRDSEPKVLNRAISEETAKQVQVMMESAVDKARVAQVSNYRIAGKTGTAQIPDFNRGGYTEQYIHSYVGFGPVSDPRFVILIKLDKPNVTLAGQTVVPAFRELAEYLIGYYHIAPDDLSDKTGN